MFLLIIGSFIAGIPNPLDPVRLFRLLVVVVVTAFALISLMFLLMVRVTDPLLPRAVFGVLNTLLYFPSGAVYPQQGFPAWMQVHRRRRSVHVCGPRVQEPAAEEHRLRGDRCRPRVPADLLGRSSMSAATRALQADAMSARPRDARTAAASRPSAVRGARLQAGHGSRDLPSPRGPTWPPSTITSATSWASTAWSSSRRSTPMCETTEAGAPGRRGSAAGGAAAPVHHASSCSACSRRGTTPSTS